MTDTALAQSAGAAAIAGYAPACNHDYTIYPSLGTLSVAGALARLFPEGQTAEPAETTRRCGPRVALAGALTALPLTKTVTLYDLVKDCLSGFGFIPGNTVVIGFMVKSADLDSGTPAVVQSIYLGSTELVTGITTGQGGTYGIYPCIPTAVTAPTAVYLKTTTAPATAASGSVTITPLYYA